MSRNSYVTAEGTVQNRPGTTFVRATKHSGTRKVRLIPFIYSDSQSYVLEFGQSYIRFHSNGGTVESSPGVVLEHATVYLEEDLPLLKFAQVGDVMTITHPTYLAQELRRTSHTSWSTTVIEFAPPSPGFNALYPPALDDNGGGLPTEDPTHPEKPWKWKVTRLREVNGVVQESAPFNVYQKFTGAYPGSRTHATAPLKLPLYFPDFFAIVDWNDGAPSGAGVIGHVIYRGQGNRFGEVGHVSAGADKFFRDLGSEPDYSRGPPQGKNPFNIYNSSGTLIGEEKPAVVSFFEQRRVFAYTPTRPSTLFFSRTDEYSNFDNNIPSVDDEGVEFQLASQRREEIRWAVNFSQRLIIGTNSSIWSLGGAAGTPLTYASIEAKVQSDVGSSWLDPLTTVGSLLYVRTKGQGIRSLAFSNERGGYTGDDITALSRHLFAGYEVVSWDWQEDPYSIVWAVRSDGILLSCTYLPESNIVAWAQHETDGIVEQVCIVPETTTDGVYLVVKRTVNGTTVRYLERMASRQVETLEEGLFLDSAVSYSGAATTSITGLGHLNGETVWALADGVVVEDLVVSAGAVTLPNAASTVHVGLPYDADVELLDLAEARTKAKTVKLATLEVVATKGLQVGEDEDTLKDVKTRLVSTGYGTEALTTQEIEAYIKNTWNKGRGRIYIRQRAPLPFELIAVTREVEIGGP